MIKKICALFLLCSMAIGFSVPAMAAGPSFMEEVGLREVEELTLVPFKDSLSIIGNGGFEHTATEDSLADWGIVTPVKGQNFLNSDLVRHNNKGIETGDPASQLVSEGGRALRLINNNAEGQTMVNQSAAFKRSESLTAYRCEYGLSVYKVSPTSSIALNAIVTLDDGEGGQVEKSVQIAFSDAPEGQWVRKMAAFTLPAETISILLVIRMTGKGDIIIDDAVFNQEADQKLIDEVKPIEKKPALEGQPKNLIGNLYPNGGNADFEYAQPAEESDYYNPGEGPWIFLADTPAEKRFSTEENHTPGGTQSILLQNITDIRGRAYIKVGDLVPGATYQLSWWYKVAQPTQTTISSEVKFWDKPKPGEYGTNFGPTLGGGYSAYQDGEWHEIVLEWAVPYPADGGRDLSAEVCIRIGGPTCSAYFDDVEFYMVKMPDAAAVKSDEAIYYTEWREGTINATADPYFEEVMRGGSMRYTILDGDKELMAPVTVPFIEGADGAITAEGAFPTSLMEANKKGQTYFYKAEIIDRDGNVLQVKTDKIFRFDRPHYLGVDGIFRKNGKEYNIGVGNGGNTKLIARDPLSVGVEVIMLVGEGTIPILERMDMAYEAGLMVMLNMGTSTMCAGSPAKIQQTRDTVRKTKDHPALFGYKVQDEPTQKLTKDEYLRDGYVAIRELDPNHVIYSCDGIDGEFPKLARYTDYMDSDHYPGGQDSAYHIFDTSENAEAASRGRKPYAILQKAYQVAPRDMYMPTLDEYRHYAYQTMFSGAAGWGFHQLGSNTDGDPVYDRPIWQELVQWEESGEQDALHDCFVNGKYPLINAYEDEEIMWQLYAVDGKLYAFVLNCVGGVGATDGSKTVEIPLTDASTGKALGGFTANCKWGGTGSASGTDKLTIEVPSFTAQTWEITLNTPANFAGHKIVKYNDIYKTPWAYQAVAKLHEKNILNEDVSMLYQPQTNVTRGDYAMFLVRALGLTAEATENFADVKPYAEYADALAIGKALGIFNGRGENMYDPEKPATRAELMALTARALRLVGKAAEGDAASLDAFSDKALIPEWAAGDVAAMVSMGIVKGNADGTVNPNGNTTRAEAAVIVDRVMNN